MLKWLIVINLVSFGILILPDWTPPYTYFETVLQFFALLGSFGVWLLILVLIFNRLVNISFRNR